MTPETKPVVKVENTEIKTEPSCTTEPSEVETEVKEEIKEEVKMETTEVKEEGESVDEEMKDVNREEKDVKSVEEKTDVDTEEERTFGKSSSQSQVQSDLIFLLFEKNGVICLEGFEHISHIYYLSLNLSCIVADCE